MSIEKFGFNLVITKVGNDLASVGGKKEKKEDKAPVHDENYLYFSAIGLHFSQCNGNGDLFPADEWMGVVSTFIGKPVNINHDRKRVVGELIEAIPVDNGKEKYAIVIGKISRKEHPEICKKMDDGKIVAVSMEASVLEAECPICKTKAHDIKDFCDHLKTLNGETEVNGEVMKHMSINHGGSFMGLALMDEILPADPNADVLKVAMEKDKKKREEEAARLLTEIDQAASLNNLDETLRKLNALEYIKLVDKITDEYEAKKKGKLDITALDYQKIWDANKEKLLQHIEDSMAKDKEGVEKVITENMLISGWTAGDSRRIMDIGWAEIGRAMQIDTGTPEGEPTAVEAPAPEGAPEGEPEPIPAATSLKDKKSMSRSERRLWILNDETMYNKYMSWLKEKGIDNDEDEEGLEQYITEQYPNDASLKVKAFNAEEVAETFINGNISVARKEIGGSIKKFNDVLAILEETSPNEVESFRRLMASDGGLKIKISKEELLKIGHEIEGIDDAELVVLGPEGMTFVWYGGNSSMVHLYDANGEEVDVKSSGKTDPEKGGITREVAQELIKSWIAEIEKEEIGGREDALVEESLKAIPIFVGKNARWVVADKEMKVLATYKLDDIKEEGKDKLEFASKILEMYKASVEKKAEQIFDITMACEVPESEWGLGGVELREKIDKVMPKGWKIVDFKSTPRTVESQLSKKSKEATPEIKKRLEELRKAIEAENISYGELAELQGLAEYIEPGDVLLLEWAGVPEFPESEMEARLKPLYAKKRSKLDKKSMIDLDTIKNGDTVNYDGQVAVIKDFTQNYVIVQIDGEEDAKAIPIAEFTELEKVDVGDVAPKSWLALMKSEAKKRFTEKKDEEIDKMVGDIWAGYSKEDKVKVIGKFYKKNGESYKNLSAEEVKKIVDGWEITEASEEGYFSNLDWMQNVKEGWIEESGNKVTLDLMDGGFVVMEKPIKSESVLQTQSSTFDKMTQVEIGDGFVAIKDKEKKSIIIKDKDGKEVKSLPDGFGDDVASVIGLIRDILGLKDSPKATHPKKDKTPVKPKENKPPEGSGEGEADKGTPKAKEPEKKEESLKEQPITKTPEELKKEADEKASKEKAELEAKLKVEMEKKASLEREAELKKREEDLKAEKDKLAKKKTSDALEVKLNRCKSIVNAMAEKNLLVVDKEAILVETGKGKDYFDVEKDLFNKLKENRVSELLTLEDKALDVLETSIKSITVRKDSARVRTPLHILPGEMAAKKSKWDMIFDRIGTARKFNSDQED